MAEGVAAHTGFQQLVLAELANLEPGYKRGVLRRVQGGEVGGTALLCLPMVAVWPKASTRLM